MLPSVQADPGDSDQVALVSAILDPRKFPFAFHHCSITEGFVIVILTLLATYFDIASIYARSQCICKESHSNDYV